MTQQKKTTTRRKPYKNMSVSELVKTRAELVDKVNQIDKILGLAVEAVGAGKVTPIMQPNRSPLGIGTTTAQMSNYDPAFGSPDMYINPQGTTPLNAQVAVNQSPPPSANPNQDISPFSIFDAESFNQQEVIASQQYELARQQEAVSQPEAPAPKDYADMSDEISTLTQEITQGLQDAANSTTTDG